MICIRMFEYFQLVSLAAGNSVWGSTIPTLIVQVENSNTTAAQSLPACSSTTTSVYPPGPLTSFCVGHLRTQTTQTHCMCFLQIIVLSSGSKGDLCMYVE